MVQGGVNIPAQLMPDGSGSLTAKESAKLISKEPTKQPHFLVAMSLH